MLDVSGDMSVLDEVSFFFFFKQKTAYEMRISDWSSDVCSSDLPAGLASALRHASTAWRTSGVHCIQWSVSAARRISERSAVHRLGLAPSLPCPRRTPRPRPLGAPKTPEDARICRGHGQGPASAGALRQSFPPSYACDAGDRKSTRLNSGH